VSPPVPAAPFDAELIRLAVPPLDSRVTVTPQMVAMIRDTVAATPADAIGDRAIKYSERAVPGPSGAPEVIVGVFERPDRVNGGAAVLYLHGGGLLFGNRCFGVAPVLDWVTELDAMIVSVEYRLAPEDPYPAAFDDSYAALQWLSAHSDELGYDASQLVLAGASAGGGLAAAVGLKARDVNGPKLAAQVLIYPMLDDRNETLSSRQYDGFGRWDRASNDTGWDAYLGEQRHRSDLPAYAAAGRAMDLSGLPPTYLDVGSAEVFRDEDVAFANRIWAHGGICELHVWGGGFHAFDMNAPEAALSRAMVQTRTAWLARTIHSVRRPADFGTI
jgi:acetyl esterase/lipase